MSPDNYQPAPYEQPTPSRENRSERRAREAEERRRQKRAPREEHVSP
jgi:hypothetical protein